jgi:CubicO group peptidase (beta-lactamase class C family)
MKTVGCVVICLLSALSAQGDTLSYGKPGDVGVSNKKLLAAAEIMKASVEADLVRGCVLLVARNHKVIFHEAYGWRDLAKKRPMKKDTLFRMASNSKAPTALAVLMLAEQGALKLDDRIHDYFLSFDHGPAAEISIRQLLTHTAGMGRRGHRCKKRWPVLGFVESLRSLVRNTVIATRATTRLQA